LATATTPVLFAKVDVTTEK